MSNPCETLSATCINAYKLKELIKVFKPAQVEVFNATGKKIFTALVTMSDSEAYFYQVYAWSDLTGTLTSRDNFKVVF